MRPCPCGKKTDLPAGKWILTAVFIPILMMSGVVGRLFREFAIVLSTAILVSMIISLTTTPMMCAHLLRDERNQSHGLLYRASESVFNGMLSIYRRSLAWVLQHRDLMLVVLLLIPTTLMGGTLPLLTRHLTRQMSGLGQSLGLLYGLNTCGAVGPPAPWTALAMNTSMAPSLSKSATIVPTPTDSGFCSAAFAGEGAASAVAF